MNKALLIPMHKEWVDLIKKGLKTRELRTWIPKGYVGTVFVVSTKSSGGSGKVELSFWFDEYDKYDRWHLYHYYDDYDYAQLHHAEFEKLVKDSCVGYDRLYAYSGAPYKDLYAWHIKKLEVFDTPKELSEFYKRIDGLDENGGFILGNLKDGEYVTIPELKKKYLLSKAPQKMVYVYVNE